MTKVRIGECKRFITDCLRAAGANIGPAKQQASLLAYADKIGHKKCGLCQLGTIITDIKKGFCNPNDQPEIVKEKSSTAYINAKKVMGATAGCFAMDMAMKKAYDTGVGWVAVKGSCYNCKPYSFWAQKAADMGLIGMVFTCERDKKEQLTVGRRAYKAIVERSAKTKLPNIDMVLNPMASRNSPPTSNLTAMVDMISGSGTPNFDSASLKSWLEEPLEENLSYCFVVLNPACFALGFDGKLIDILPHWKQESMDPNLLETPLSSLEKQMCVKTNDTGIITYEAEIIMSSNVLAKTLNVKPMCYLKMEKKMQ